MARFTFVLATLSSTLVFLCNAKPQSSTTGAENQITTIPYPPLTGPQKIGTTSFELIDHSREDPYAPGPRPQKRKLMVQLFYPTDDTSERTFAPIFLEKTAAYLDNLHGMPPGTLEKFETRAYANASMKSSHQLPMVLFSHSLDTPRGAYTSYVQNLASEGFLVVAIDHTYDSTIVEFSNGELIEGRKIVNTTEDMVKALDVRVKDINFIINQHAKQAFEKKLPGCHSIQSGRVGVVGHLLGGATALKTLQQDHSSRIAGGINIDGTFVGDEILHKTKKPFLFLSDSNHTRENDATWGESWKHLRGWKGEARLSGSTNSTFLDFPIILELLNLTKKVDPTGAQFGTIGGIRSSFVVSKYLAAFFDFTLKGEETKLFDGPNARFPEMAIIPN